MSSRTSTDLDQLLGKLVMRNSRISTYCYQHSRPWR